MIPLMAKGLPSTVIKGLQDNRYLIAYVSGLIIVALAVTASHILVDRKMQITRQASEALEMGYGQSFLAERINHLAYRYVASSDGSDKALVGTELATAVERMYQSHGALLRLPLGTDIGLPADEIYFAPEYELDLKIRTFLGAARELSSRPAADIKPGSPLIRFLDRDKTSQLHELLKKALDRYRKAEDEALANSNRTLWTLYVLIMVILVLEGIAVSRLIVKSLLRQAEDYRELAHTDPLTGCCNRRSFMAACRQEHELVHKHGKHCAVIMLDIDRFKQVNDTYGHAVGDEVIQALVKVSLEQLRDSDVLGRMGGEEFAILLRGTPGNKAWGIADALRQSLQACDVDLPAPWNDVLHFTVSLGVAELRASDESPLDALERADQALYDAKTGGRNRVMTAL